MKTEIPGVLLLLLSALCQAKPKLSPVCMSEVSKTRSKEKIQWKKKKVEATENYVKSGNPDFITNRGIYGIHLARNCKCFE